MPSVSQRHISNLFFAERYQLFLTYDIGRASSVGRETIGELFFVDHQLVDQRFIDCQLVEYNWSTFMVVDTKTAQNAFSITLASAKWAGLRLIVMRLQDRSLLNRESNAQRPAERSKTCFSFYCKKSLTRTSVGQLHSRKFRFFKGRNDGSTNWWLTNEGWRNVRWGMRSRHWRR